MKKSMMRASISSLLVLGTLCGGCTPETTKAVDWVVVNTTGDTLVVATRYPLDSVLVSSADKLTETRREWGRDSTDFESESPLMHLRQHGSTWYYVFTRETEMRRYLGDSGAGSVLRTNRRRGLFIYDVPPRAKQILFQRTFSGAHSFFFDPPTPPMSGLLLQQGEHYRWVLPSQSLKQVFRVNPRQEDWFWDSSHQLDLVVGPDLTVNPWLRRFWYNWWTQTIR